MDLILKSGQKVRTSTTRSNCVVEKFLGGGGQGEVGLIYHPQITQIDK